MRTFYEKSHVCNFNTFKAIFMQPCILNLETAIKEMNKLATENSRKNGIIEKLKQETNALKNQLETSESNLRKSNKALKMKEKEIHDLKKESDKAKDDLA